jgi:hypothetical protein
MRLSKVEKQLPSAQVNVTLPGKLKLELDGYAAYYNHIHGEAIGIRRIIVEIVRNFVESDREFQAWLKRHSNAVGDANGGPTPASMR